MHDLLFLLSKGIGFKNLNDMWMEYWDSLSVPEIAFNDRMLSWLGSLGYTGAYSDRYSAWVRDTPITPNDCFLDPESGEYFPNWSFDCGLFRWGHDPKYPATLTDNGDGSVHLKADSDFGSLVPDKHVYPDGKYIIECRVANISGAGKMSVRDSVGVWTNHVFTIDGTHTLIYEGDISELHFGADSDPAYEADYEYISMREYVETRTPCMTSDHSPYGVVTESSKWDDPGQYQGWRGMNCTTVHGSDAWISEENVPMPQWVQWVGDAGQGAMVPDRIVITGRNIQASHNTAHAPKKMTLHGTIDGTNFVPIQTWDDLDFGAHRTYDLPISGTDAFIGIRLVVDEIRDTVNIVCQIGTFTVYGYASTANNVTYNGDPVFHNGDQVTNWS